MIIFRKLFVNIGVIVSLILISCQNELDKYAQKEDVVFLTATQNIQTIRDSIKVVTVKEFKNM